MKTVLPIPTISRMCALYGLCATLLEESTSRASSAQLGRLLGCSSNSVRKDISSLGVAGETGSGYQLNTLRLQLGEKLGLEKIRRACVVGLGRLGTALLAYEHLSDGAVTIVAGFESSINRLETLRTRVPIYPDHEIAEVVRRERIELALIAVPAMSAMSVAQSLVQGGVTGILNFAPVRLALSVPGVIVRNMDVVNELRIVSAQLLSTGVTQQ